MKSAAVIDAIDRARKLVPWEQVRAGVEYELEGVDPGLATLAASLPKAAFGVQSGFFYLPVAQAVAWGEPDIEWLLRMAVTFGLGHLYYVLHDRVVDTGHLPARLAVLMDAALVRFIGTGTRLGVGEREFLDTHQQAAGAYARALQRDITHRESRRPYTASDVFLLGEKAAPAVLSMLVVTTRCHRHAQMPALSSALTWMCSALQLLDDLGDLRDDFEQGNITFPIMLGVGALDQSGRGLADVEAVLDALYLSGGGTAALRLARHCLNKAEGCLAVTDADVVMRLVRAWNALTQRFIDQISKGGGQDLSC